MSNNRTALIVDDNDTNRLLAKALLTRMGWATEEANCGDIALQKAREKDFPLILLDISMPGLSGEQTCTALRELNKKMFIIAYTAHAFPEEREKFLAAGFDDILVKPINRAQLEAMVGPL